MISVPILGFVAVILLLALCVASLSAISFFFGRQLGRACRCCGFSKECRFCVDAGCDKAEHVSDRET